MTNKPTKYIISLILIITIINLIFIFIFSFFWRHLNTGLLVHTIYYLSASLCSAIFITFFVVTSAPVLKDFLATYRQLLRLENLSHPLLMKLSLEAAGTYHHSLSVANLANRAAKTIKADSLLTRVGAYYHDIGKVTRPDFFIENQKEGENPHDQIDDPKKNFEIIKNHISDGIKLAEEYHLPKEVIAFIAEHQGTQLSYFYQIAKNKNEKSKKSDFRYPGPKPLSRETAIVMLADVIEAKVRLLDKVNSEKISNIVEETIQEKLLDKQLDLSGLSNKDLGLIKKSFIETLQVMYHQRIEYKNGDKTNFSNFKR